MNEIDTVTVTIDERTVQVPKGTGMVETAPAAGIEIPVGPLGPPVGAHCRGGAWPMQVTVVKTARTSAQAADGQNSTLEFILATPVDRPVCDKGGECPLQDLTFRYGPGTPHDRSRSGRSRSRSRSRRDLDRERCILCYRCTRFSESVAEDGQLVAINRGSQSVIVATFEDEPYTRATSQATSPRSARSAR